MMKVPCTGGMVGEIYIPSQIFRAAGGVCVLGLNTLHSLRHSGPLTMARYSCNIFTCVNPCTKRKDLKPQPRGMLYPPQGTCTKNYEEDGVSVILLSKYTWAMESEVQYILCIIHSFEDCRLSNQLSLDAHATRSIQAPDRVVNLQRLEHTCQCETQPNVLHPRIRR